MPISWPSFLLITSLLSFTPLTVDATEVIRRPHRFKHIIPNNLTTDSHPTMDVVQRRSGSKASFAYFTNWGIYAPNFQPTDIVSSTLTHVLYAFAAIDEYSGTVRLTDNYADETKLFPGDSESEPGNNLYGNLKQLYLLKLKQRNLKVLLSIGGWTYSQAGHFGFVTNSLARARFVASAVQLIEDYGFDGVDLDFEFPTAANQAQGLAEVLTALRSSFNALQTKKGDSTRYLVTAAVSAGPDEYAMYKVSQMDAALDYWNLMAYDYSGPWLNTADSMDNLYGGERTGYSTNAAIEWYIENGASSSKINLGMPLYGRAFEKTKGLGQPYVGVGSGTFEAGVYPCKDLPLAGAEVYENTTEVSSYSYDPRKEEFVTFDTPNIVKLKAQYINARGLAGATFWELSTDRVGSASLVGTVASFLGSLEQSENHIRYPNSKWDNIKNNLGQGDRSATTITGSTSDAYTTTRRSTHA